MTTKTVNTKQSELVALRGKWFKERTRLYDRETGLPDRSRSSSTTCGQWLEDTGSLSVLVFRPSSEGHVEEVWGWEAYDDLLLDFVRRLKAFQTDGVVPTGTFCLPNVRSDESSSSCPESGAVVDDRPASARSGELDQLIRGYLAERAEVSARFAPSSGHAHHEGPQAPVERLIYRGVQEARDQVTRQTVRQEIRGGELLQDAISRSDIRPVFQPVFDLATGNMIGMEALSAGRAAASSRAARPSFRWPSAPNFSCRSNASAASGRSRPGAGAYPRRQIFLNLSPAAASDPEFLGPVFRDQVVALGLEPDRIVLEITERTYAVYEGLFREVLSKFRSQNFRIAVDDVGTGYSNLSPSPTSSRTT